MTPGVCVCVCVCAYVCAYVCMHTCMCVNTCFIYIYIYTHTHTHTQQRRGVQNQSDDLSAFYDQTMLNLIRFLLFFGVDFLFVCCCFLFLLRVIIFI